MGDDAIRVIEAFIAKVRSVRDEFEPLGVPARRIAQLDIVIMEAEAERRRLLVNAGGGPDAAHAAPDTPRPA